MSLTNSITRKSFNFTNNFSPIYDWGQKRWSPRFRHIVEISVKNVENLLIDRAVKKNSLETGEQRTGRKERLSNERFFYGKDRGVILLSESAMQHAERKSLRLRRLISFWPSLANMTSVLVARNSPRDSSRRADQECCPSTTETTSNFITVKLFLPFFSHFIRRASLIFKFIAQ